jgi:peptide/nickel transport system permease protein
MRPQLAGAVAQERGRGALRLIGRPLPAIGRLAREPAGAFGLAVVGMILFIAVFAPLLAPHDPYAIAIPDRFQGPSAAHLLGTDGVGRDTLSRLIIATRTAMEVALPSVAIAFSIGLVIGLLAGYLGGVADSAMIIVNDTLQAFPGIVLALVVIALLGPSLRNVIVLIAIAIAPGYFRVSRALVLSAREETYVEAERALGARTLRILSHVVPNVIAPMMVLVAMDIPGVIGIDAGLSFLGLGVQPPTPSWGGILSDGYESIEQSVWPVVAGTAFLALATLGFTFLGEALRNVIDPRVGQRVPGGR